MRPLLKAFCLCAALFFAAATRADEIEMQNGDRYNGKVLAMTSDIVTLQSDVLGKVTLPRSKIARISLGAAVSPAALPGATNGAPAIPPTLSTNSAESALATLRQSGIPAADAAKVKQQLLSDADPAAKAKFDQMMNDLLSGKMNLSDLRAQAQSAADQLRKLKKELGPESDSTLDSYLSVLESFLKEVPADGTLAPTNPATTPNGSDDKER